MAVLTNDRETKDIMKNLPIEMMMRIFELLSYTDLKKVLLVSRWWRKIGETPRLWSSLPVTVNSRNISVIPHLLRSPRLHQLKKLKIEVSLTKRVSQAIVKHPGLRTLMVVNIKLTPRQAEMILTRVRQGSKLVNLDISGNNRSRVDKELLAKAATKLATLNVNNAQLTKEQVVAVFTALSEQGRMVNLFIGKNNLSEVDPELLRKSTRKMETLSIVCSQLTQQQIVAIFNAVNEGRKLTNVYIRCNNLSRIDTGLLAKAVTKLVSLNVTKTQLTHEQIVTIFDCISKGSRLTNLAIDSNNLSGVYTGLLAKAATKLELLCVGDTKLTHNQIVAILTAVSEGKTLTNLDMSWNDLSGVNTTLLSKAVTRLQKLSVLKTQLTLEQTLAIMTAVSTGGRLTQLYISGNRLSGVDPELFSKAVTNLETLSANCTQLSKQQIVAILTAISETSNLANLHIRCCNLSRIDIELLVNATKNLGTFNITNTELTQEQIVAILTGVSKARKLSRLYLGGQDLTGIDPGLMAKAGSKVYMD